ncbi:MAG: hypothetical protein CL681_09095 [Blastopirellula sp.]|nr:hypothetical protein [Blastopirellula sp.]
MIELGIFDASPHVQLTIPSHTVRLQHADQPALTDNHLAHPRLHGIDLTLELIEGASEKKLRVTNAASTLLLEDGQRLKTGIPQTLPLPVRLYDGDRVLMMDDPRRLAEDHQQLETIERPRQNGNAPVVSLETLGKPPGAATVSRWLEALGILQQSTASAPHFFRTAAEFVTHPGGLDMALVLLRDGTDWEIKASRWVDEELGDLYRHDIIDQVATEARTFFHSPPSTDQPSQTQSTTAVVASPIFDRHGTVTGIVYGARHLHRLNARQGIRPLEAQWVQLVAEAVSAGIIRLETEAENIRTRVLLEQAFPPTVAQQLALTPQALRSEQRPVSLLFADIRESTKLATQLAPDTLNTVFTEILELLTEQVLSHGGVIVDYSGDGLAAMWNAPISQANHATLACQSAMEILRALPAWNAKWAHQLPAKLQLGMGVHTGTVTVGNTGSQRRFKYGPRGLDVALACRVETSTKRLGVPLVITEATRRELSPDAVTRRLCTAHFSEFETTVELFELCGMSCGEVDASQKRWIDMHETALSAITAGELEAACDQLISMTNATARPDPLLKELLGRVEQRLDAAQPANAAHEPQDCLVFELSPSS